MPAPAAAAAQAGTTSDTGTNVQVAGVDEADVSKRSGDLVLTVTGRRAGLTVLRTSADRAELVGRLDPGWRPDSLLVQGSTVLLVGSVPLRVPEPVRGSHDEPARSGPPVPRPRNRPDRPDAGRPGRHRRPGPPPGRADPRRRRLRGGRQAVRRRPALAISARPSRLPFVMPQSAAPGDTSTVTQAVQEALAHNRSVVAASTVDDWLPHYTLMPALGKPSSGTLLGCASIGVPDGFSGLGTLAMLTFDLRTEGIGHWNGAGGRRRRDDVVLDRRRVTPSRHHHVVGGAGSGSGRGCREHRPAPPRTQIHAFATTSDGVRYLGSGQVDGRLLDQYSLDEYQGRLRVATTIEPGLGRRRRRAATPGPRRGRLGGREPTRPLVRRRRELVVRRGRELVVRCRPER